MSQLTAMTCVLETPELLEMILSDLPPLQLLMIQRVNSLWNSLISHSPQLQKLMFMRPDMTLQAKPFDPTIGINNRPGERPKNNLMVRRILNGLYPTFTMNVVSAQQEEETEKKSVDIPDEGHEIDMPRKPHSTSGHWAWDVNIQYPANRLPTDNPAVLYEKASWRRMYLSQPPCNELYLVRRWQRARNPAITCETGITMDMFINKANKANEAWNELFISSDSDWHFEGPIRCSNVIA